MTPQQPDSEPSAPIRFTVTVQCKSCRVRIQVSSRKTRLEYKFTCPRCSTVNNIVLATPIEPPPQSHVPPDVYQLAASPPLPIAKRLPPIAYPLSPPKPIDLFAQALASNAPVRTTSNEPRELQTIRTLARFGLIIAKSDGQVANAERIAVREFLATLFGHNAILARHIDPIMEAAEKAIPTEADAIADVVRCMPSEKRYAVYVAAEKIADACGTRNQPEIDALRRVAIAFGMQPAALKIEPVPLVPPKPEVEQRAPEAPTLNITGLHSIPALARFGLMVAKADGYISDPERSAVRAFLATLFGHDAILSQHIDSILFAAQKAIPSETVAIAEVVECTSPDKRRAIYLATEKIAEAWLPRNQSEIDTLQRVAIAFGMEPTAPKIELAPQIANVVRLPTPPNPEATRRVAEAFPSQKVTPPKSLFAFGDPRKLLEIEPKMQLSVELIRRRFAMLSEKTNPKRAAAFGPEFVALAEKHLAELQAAAESLIAPFGVPLVARVAPPTPPDMRHNPDLDDVFG